MLPGADLVVDLATAGEQQIAVRDIWAKKEVGTFDASSMFVTAPIGGHDSHFYIFTLTVKPGRQITTT